MGILSNPFARTFPEMLASGFNRLVGWIWSGWQTIAGRQGQIGEAYPSSTTQARGQAYDWGEQSWNAGMQLLGGESYNPPSLSEWIDTPDEPGYYYDVLLTGVNTAGADISTRLIVPSDAPLDLQSLTDIAMGAHEPDNPIIGSPDWQSIIQEFQEAGVELHIMGTWIV